MTEVAPSWEVLCRYDGRVALVRESRVLAAGLHPELTDDLRLHRYFHSTLQGESVAVSPDEQEQPLALPQPLLDLAHPVSGALAVDVF